MVVITLTSMNPEEIHIEEHLLLQYLLGKSRPEDRKTLEAWLRKSEKNQAELDRLEALWLKTGKLFPPPLAVDTDASWAKLSDRIDAHESSRHTQKRNLWSVPYLKYALSAAAGIILIIGIFSLIKFFTGTTRKKELVSTVKVVRDTLPDGSRIMLNKNSKLAFPEHFEDVNREVTLIGEGFFEVKKNHSSPFIVNAGPAKVKVLGTSFSISAYPGKDIRVTVSEGTVLFFCIDNRNGDTLSVQLKGGSSAILKPGATKPEKIGNTSPDNLFWVNRTLDFKATSLEDVFILIEKYYHIRILASNKEIKNCKLSASFVDEPVSRIMTVIAESFGLQITMDGQNYILTGDGCRN